MRPTRMQIRILIAAGLLAATTAGVAFALPANEVETYYYSDASKTEEVGHTLLACNGSHFSNGVTTAYFDTTVTPCD